MDYRQYKDKTYGAINTSEMDWCNSVLDVQNFTTPTSCCQAILGVKL